MKEYDQNQTLKPNEDFPYNILSFFRKERAAKAMKQAAFINQSRRKEGKALAYPSTMMSRERQVRENYEFLKKHIHDAPVTPMMPSIWEGVLAKIDASLTGVPRAAELLQQTKEELAQDYEKNLRKFMGLWVQHECCL